MRIGLLSDTHIPEVARGLPPQIAEAFRDVDLVLHAGDIYAHRVLDELEGIAPVLAAEGDDDYGDTLTDERVKKKHVLKIEGQTLWLIHERPYVHMLRSQQTGKPPAQDRFDTPDIIVFGHEHRVALQRSGDVLYVNPGSPTFLHYRRGLGTVGILSIEPDEAEVAILQLMAENHPATVASQTRSSAHHRRTRRRQRMAEELMKLTEGELAMIVVEKVMGWRPALEGLETSHVESTAHLWKDQNDHCHSHRPFCSDTAASSELNERMYTLGWHHSMEPTSPGEQGFWGYGIAYSSQDYWVGLQVESPSQILRAKCVAAILAVDMLAR
jgi:hypothetical protein